MQLEARQVPTSRAAPPSRESPPLQESDRSESPPSYLTLWGDYSATSRVDPGEVPWAGRQAGFVPARGGGKDAEDDDLGPLAMAMRKRRPERPLGRPTSGRFFLETVFAEVVTGTTPVLTLPRFDSLLGQEDALGLEIITNHVTGGGTPAMTVDVLHSNSRRHWVVSHAGIVAFWISTTGPSFFYAPVSEPPVGLAFRRLRITLIPVGAPTNSAEVTIRACGRNVGA
jgi:hypothetical protein